MAARSPPRGPEDPPKWTLSDRQRTCLLRARAMARLGVCLAGGVAARAVGLLGSAMGSRRGPVYGQLVVCADGGHRDAVRELAEAGLLSCGQVCTALDETGRSLLASTVEGGAEVVAARREDAAEATRAMGGVDRDAVLMELVVTLGGARGLRAAAAVTAGHAATARVLPSPPLPVTIPHQSTHCVPPRGTSPHCLRQLADCRGQLPSAGRL